jgi:hypothetical protein
MTYTISIEPSSKAGQITATSSDGHTFTTSTPLLEGARYWLSMGANPADPITPAWSSGSTHWSLRSTVRHAAKLTVDDGDRGPRFARWKPFPRSAVAPPISFPGRLAPNLPDTRTGSQTALGASIAASPLGRFLINRKRCVGSSGRLLPSAPPAEKATASQ